MENLCVSKRYRLMFNPERTTKQKINITPRRIVKFITVLCWRQFEAISSKALVVLRINEWLCFLRVPSGISRIYTNQSFVDACRELERERENSFRRKWDSNVWMWKRQNVQTSLRTLSIGSKLMTGSYVDNLIDIETLLEQNRCVDMILFNMWGQ